MSFTGSEKNTLFSQNRRMLKLLSCINENGGGSTDMSAILAELQAINSNTDGLELTAESINLNTDTLESLIAISNTELSNVNTELDNIEATLTVLETVAQAACGSGNEQNVQVCNMVDVSGLQTSLTALEGHVDGLEGLITASNAFLATMDVALGNIDVDASTIITNTADTVSQLTDVNTELDTITTQLTTLNAKLNEDCTGAPINVNVCNAGAGGGLVPADLATLETNTGNTVTELQAVNTELDTQTIALGDVNTELDNIEATLNTIETYVQPVTSTVTVVHEDRTAASTIPTFISGSIAVRQGSILIDGAEYSVGDSISFPPLSAGTSILRYPGITITGNSPNFSYRVHYTS